MLVRLKPTLGRQVLKFLSWKDVSRCHGVCRTWRVVWDTTSSTEHEKKEEDAKQKTMMMTMMMSRYRFWTLHSGCANALDLLTCIAYWFEQDTPPLARPRLRRPHLRRMLAKRDPDEDGYYETVRQELRRLGPRLTSHCDLSSSDLHFLIALFGMRLDVAQRDDCKDAAPFLLHLTSLEINMQFTAALNSDHALHFLYNQEEVHAMLRAIAFHCPNLKCLTVHRASGKSGSTCIGLLIRLLPRLKRFTDFVGSPETLILRATDAEAD